MESKTTGRAPLGCASYAGPTSSAAPAKHTLPLRPEQRSTTLRPHTQTTTLSTKRATKQTNPRPPPATVGVVTERNAERAIEELKAYEVGGLGLFVFVCFVCFVCFCLFLSVSL